VIEDVLMVEDELVVVVLVLEGEDMVVDEEVMAEFPV
jgi:hypothetical protein